MVVELQGQGEYCHVLRVEYAGAEEQTHGF